MKTNQPCEHHSSASPCAQELRQKKGPFSLLIMRGAPQTSVFTRTALPFITFGRKYMNGIWFISFCVCRVQCVSECSAALEQPRHACDEEEF